MREGWEKDRQRPSFWWRWSCFDFHHRSRCLYVLSASPSCTYASFCYPNVSCLVSFLPSPDETFLLFFLFSSLLLCYSRRILSRLQRLLLRTSGYNCGLQSIQAHPGIVGARSLLIIGVWGSGVWIVGKKRRCESAEMRLHAALFSVVSLEC